MSIILKAMHNRERERERDRETHGQRLKESVSPSIHNCPWVNPIQFTI